MSTRSCRYEADVHEAAVTGRWTTELGAHARGCPMCDDVLLVAAALKAPMPAPPSGTDPAALWVCGRHARRLTVEARISTVVIGTQLVVLGAVAAVLVSFVDWPSLWQSARTIDTSSWGAGLAIGLMVSAFAAARALSQDH